MSHLCIIAIKIKEYQKFNLVHVADVPWMISERIDSMNIVDALYFIIIQDN